MLHRASRISRFNPLTRVNRASQAHRYALVTPRYFILFVAIVNGSLLMI